jgi:hypothetical protein
MVSEMKTNLLTETSSNNKDKRYNELLSSSTKTGTGSERYIINYINNNF